MTDRVLQKVHQGAARFQSGDFAAALALAEDALNGAPDHPEALHLAALALGRLGRIDAAIAAYDRAVLAHPQKQAVLSNLGNALSAAGRFDEAIEAYRRAVAIDPGFVNGWYNLGGALKCRGDAIGAIAALRNATRLDPRNSRARNNLGLLLKDAGDSDGAHAAFSAAIAADPDFAAALVNRGALLRDRGDLQAGLADLRKAAALAPDLNEAHYQLANGLRMAGLIDEAARAYARAIDSSPQSVAAHRDLANMLWEAGRGDIFLSALAEAITRAPSAALIDLYAELSFRTGNIASAQAAAERLMAFAPADAAGPSRLARVRRHQGRRAAAVNLARRAHGFAPDDYAILHEYAEALLGDGRYADAAQALAGEAPREHLQKHIALRAVALRAAGDQGYRRYYDYDRFAAKLFIDPPRGFASVADFNAALYEALLPLHLAKKAQPIDQTLYGGTQSLGRLWNEPHPVIQAMKAALMAAAMRYVEALPDDPSHPFLAMKSRTLDCAGAWSVVLASGGGHVDHIHPKGWISASYYVKVPEEVALGEKAGFIRLGASGVEGLALPAERWIRPEEGAVVFFPSYMWHGVEPFAAASPRVTAPFDLAPR